VAPKSHLRNARHLSAQIDSKYESLGGAEGFLGAPSTNEEVCPDGTGHYRHYENFGSIYWHPHTGAHEVHGLIRNKWAALGWERSVLGYPRSDEGDCPVGGGKYSNFQGGTILWFPPQSEAFEVHHAIRNKFGELGFEGGILGFPITDETTTPDGVGRFNHFQHGSIYWKNSISAHAIYGDIRAYWSEHGWETNEELGYPISDELAGSGNNRYSDFENGVLYWNHGSRHVSPLERLTIGNASKSAADVLKDIDEFVRPMIQKDRVAIKDGPYMTVLDYHWDGNRVVNRRYKLRYNLGIGIDFFSDPSVELDLTILIEYAKPGKAIISTLTDWYAHVHVPWDATAVVSAEEIMNELENAIDPEIGVVYVLRTIDEPINLLSVKVMPNGDLNVYAG